MYSKVSIGKEKTGKESSSLLFSRKPREKESSFLLSSRKASEHNAYNLFFPRQIIFKERRGELPVNTANTKMFLAQNYPPESVFFFGTFLLFLIGFFGGLIGLMGKSGASKTGEL